jgi:hypothetical protein
MLSAIDAALCGLGRDAVSRSTSQGWLAAIIEETPRSGKGVVMEFTENDNPGIF